MSSFRILLVGGGGREHALAWKLSQSPLVEHIFTVPGNGGTASLDKVTNVSSISETSPKYFEQLVKFAKDNDVNVVLPGPEQPLVDGIVDYVNDHTRGRGTWCFGPTQAAAMMEGSKAYAKDFMRRFNIPTAEYRNFNKYEEAKEYLDSVSHDVVIKASGLAAGKGVIIPQNKQEAHDALKDIMLDKEFGAAGDEVVIEEFLEGEEISILSFCDGKSIKSLPPAQDHKRIGDGDTGPNTGGMGTYAPTKAASDAELEQIHKTVLQPTIDGMREEGYPMVGCLFTGLMMTKNGPRVLEYNVRFGDPETQSLVVLMKSDLAKVIEACMDEKLESFELEVDSKFAATVVVASGGYPGSYKKGVEMKLDSVPNGVVLFHAGTTLDGGVLKTSGGRVIASTASGETLEDAVQTAYKGVNCIHFDGMQYRKDIAHRALR
ncbi:phosphoribosylamine-glycine ligase [Rhizodiscina lignyota]|uniref:phosphoribosylamine--glycine ligase n=1 Tax=Rhizodiscina lignyota TaxID=1504668 RepID=A0A9P4M6P0_9PEZI|nr:phosphoribosylamine-glycine ligase [Rhizodiscina lignyota]